MKNAFGATLLFQIVIFFVIVFTGYICLSINQSKAFNVKNEIVKIVERHAPDFGADFSADLAETMENEGYRLAGDCSRVGAGYIGYDRTGHQTSSSERAAFCLLPVKSTIAGGLSNTGQPNAVYYRIVTFYQLDIPIINVLFNLTARGETKLIYNSKVR